ncbi:AraC family transcriptional regulator [Raoultella planticola]|nr:AraC family transcriptional regulator [Raoultella planticola]
MVGIVSPYYFIKIFKNHFGITPKQFVIYFRN